MISWLGSTSSLTSEAAMPELPDPSLAWEDLSAE